MHSSPANKSKSNESPMRGKTPAPEFPSSVSPKKLHAVKRHAEKRTTAMVPATVSPTATTPVAKTPTAASPVKRTAQEADIVVLDGPAPKVRGVESDTTQGNISTVASSKGGMSDMFNGIEAQLRACREESTQELSRVTLKNVELENEVKRLKAKLETQDKQLAELRKTRDEYHDLQDNQLDASRVRLGAYDNWKFVQELASELRENMKDFVKDVDDIQRLARDEMNESKPAQTPRSKRQKKSE
ncbi:uncharacterized protein LDX57_008754 [Aspergillus melleus]|uniref:uncharacterized protein n=1 Tax=Aspergillus melleus TaxID=138277 RepID=UPI001E8D973B|nr:uncharacterized protein LDX57_008754 [Aspergillus melleus]KAH8431093.1 hypothetical protein LDX57_008754 [Aspergillus melleus]